MTLRRAVLLVGASILIAALAQWQTRPRAGACALDGIAIEPVYAVTVEAESATRRYCSIVCAVTDFQRDPPVGTILVHDEVTGEPLAAERARYVETDVTVVRAGNRVHVFADWATALKHIEVYEGTPVACPFSPWLKTQSDASPDATQSDDASGGR